MKRVQGYRLKALLPALGLLLAACGGGGGPSGTQVRVQLVDGLGEPVNAVAAAYRAGGSWQVLNPQAPGDYRFTVPSGQDRYQVVFRCPYFGLLSSRVLVVSFDLKTVDATQFTARCPFAYGGPVANLNQTDDNTSSQDFNGGFALAYSATSPGFPIVDEGGDGVFNDLLNGFTLPVGAGREVVIFGQIGGTYYFGRKTVNVTPTTTGVGTVTINPVGATFDAVLPPGAFGQARLLTDKGVAVDYSLLGLFLNPGTNTLPKPSSLATDLYDLRAFSGNIGVLKRIPGNTLPATLNLTLPTATFAPSAAGSAGDTPSFSNLTASGLTLAHKAYLFNLNWGGSTWEHWVSAAALGGATSYQLPNPSSVPGLAALVPTTGDSVSWIAAALAMDQPLGSFLQAPPLPWLPWATFFQDRFLALSLEGVSGSGSFTQP